MNYRESWNLATIPDDVLKSEWSRRLAQWRANLGAMGGRPRTLRTCEKCGQAFGARQLREHAPHCTGA